MAFRGTVRGGSVEGAIEAPDGGEERATREGAGVRRVIRERIQSALCLAMTREKKN